MEKGFVPRQYAQVTIENLDFQAYILPALVELIASAKSVIIFVLLSIVLLIGLSLLPKSPETLVTQQYQYQYQYQP